MGFKTVRKTAFAKNMKGRGIISRGPKILAYCFFFNVLILNGK